MHPLHSSTLPTRPREGRVHPTTSTSPPSPNLTYTVSSLGFSLVAVVAWMVQAFDTSNNVLFSTATNMNAVFIVGVLLFMAYMYRCAGHPIIFGLLVCTTLSSASSFAFHSSPTSGTHRHTLDIFMGWYLYLYLSVLAPFALLHSRLATTEARRKAFTFVTLTLHFAASTAIVSLYDSIYRSAEVFYVSCGAVVYVCVAGLRVRHHLILTGEEGKRGEPKTLVVVAAVARAGAEVALLLGLQATYVVLQGELWHASMSEERKNVEHGYWHIGNGFVVCIVALYVMQDADDARRQPKDIGHRVSPWSEWAVLACFVAFHILLVSLSFVMMPHEVYCGLIATLQTVLLLVSAWSLWTHHGSVRRHWSAVLTAEGAV